MVRSSAGSQSETNVQKSATSNLYARSVLGLVILASHSRSALHLGGSPSWAVTSALPLPVFLTLAKPFVPSAIIRTLFPRPASMVSTRIYHIDRVVLNVSVKIWTAAGEADRVLSDEPLGGAAIVSRPIKIEPGAIVFTAGELIRIAVAVAAGGRRAERLISVICCDRAAGSTSPMVESQRIGQQRRGRARGRPAEEFDHAQPTSCREERPYPRSSAIYRPEQPQ